MTDEEVKTWLSPEERECFEKHLRVFDAFTLAGYDSEMLRTRNWLSEINLCRALAETRKVLVSIEEYETNECNLCGKGLWRGHEPDCFIGNMPRPKK